jgi:hypothetical protein
MKMNINITFSFKGKDGKSIFEIWYDLSMKKPPNIGNSFIGKSKNEVNIKYEC